MPDPPLPVTGDPDADRLLADDPLALLLGMLLDQQVPMEWAFRGPATLRARLGHLDAARIAAMDPEELEAAFRQKPALHRYPKAMARRAQELCRHVVEVHGGDPARIWRDGSADEVLARLRSLPGYGEEKAKILLAVLGKRFGAAPAGWEEAAAPFSDAQPRSVADVDSPEALARVRAFKQARKAAGRTKAD
jgi:uncharacterized HhH-GPD family protein